MVPQALRMAQSALHKYKTRDPYEIIDAKHIRLWPFERPETLLGVYKVWSRTQYIGINSAADGVQRLTGVLHELGHALNDYKAAASGLHFEDNFGFFSMSAAPMENSANLTAAELYIEDDFILNRIYYEQYRQMAAYISAHIDRYRTDRARMQFENEHMQDFYSSHSDMPSYDQLACELGVDVGLVKFKFKALAYKDYDLHNIPETRADFLRNWQH